MERFDFCMFVLNSFTTCVVFGAFLIGFVAKFQSAPFISICFLFTVVFILASSLIAKQRWEVPDSVFMFVVIVGYITLLTTSYVTFFYSENTVFEFLNVLRP